MCGLYQRRIGLAPFARRQAVEPVGADRDPHQAQGREADGGGHAPHLAIAALGDRHLQPCRWHMLAEADRRVARPQCRLRDDVRLCRAGASVVERHAASQLTERRFPRYTFHLHPIGLGQLMARVGDARLQATVIGEQQQSLAVVVEPPGGTHARQLDELGECAPAIAVGELAQHVERLVEQDQHGKLQHLTAEARRRGGKAKSSCSLRLRASAVKIIIILTATRCRRGNRVDCMRTGCAAVRRRYFRCSAQCQAGCRWYRQAGPRRFRRRASCARLRQ